MFYLVCHRRDVFAPPAPNDPHNQPAAYTKCALCVCGKPTVDSDSNSHAYNPHIARIRPFLTLATDSFTPQTKIIINAYGE